MLIYLYMYKINSPYLGYRDMGLEEIPFKIVTKTIKKNRNKFNQNKEYYQTLLKDLG